MRSSRAALLLLLMPADALAQIRVNPTGVNVNSMGPTTVFLAYGGIADHVPVEAFWCGRLVSAAPGVGSRCDPSTIYGRLPFRYDQSRANGSSFTDVMSIPPSVARLAYQDAAAGETSSFYYVRRFVSSSGRPDEYVAVTCRLTGGGARTPFALTSVTLAFDVDAPVLFVEPGTTPPNVSAEIHYNGTGTLRGRWEVVLPTDEPPSVVDRMTAASLPPEERGSQRTYTEVGRFAEFLPPNGRVLLPGPDASRLPTAAEGAYLVLLRIEASNDKEGDVDLRAIGAGTTVVHNGAVAGFPLPVLRYVVGAGSSELHGRRHTRALPLLLPRDGAAITRDSAFSVGWVEDREALLYRVEFAADDGTTAFSALLAGGSNAYQAPSFLAERIAGAAVRWRVLAFDSNGREMRRSAWRRLTWTTP